MFFYCVEMTFFFYLYIVYGSVKGGKTNFQSIYFKYILNTDLRPFLKFISNWPNFLSFQHWTSWIQNFDHGTIKKENKNIDRSTMFNSNQNSVRKKNHKTNIFCYYSVSFNVTLKHRLPPDPPQIRYVIFFSRRNNNELKSEE